LATDNDLITFNYTEEAFIEQTLAGNVLVAVNPAGINENLGRASLYPSTINTNGGVFGRLAVDTAAGFIYYSLQPGLAALPEALAGTALGDGLLAAGGVLTEIGVTGGAIIAAVVVDSILQNKEVKQLGYQLNPFHWKL
jgi:hypothetical protein